MEVVVTLVILSVFVAVAGGEAGRDGESKLVLMIEIYLYWIDGYYCFDAFSSDRSDSYEPPRSGGVPSSCCRCLNLLYARQLLIALDGWESIIMHLSHKQARQESRLAGR